MFEVGMSALVLKICSEYAKSLGLNFPPCTQQEINAICEWVDKHTIKDMTISQNGYNVTFTFKTENDTTKEFTFTIPKTIDIGELEKVLVGSESVVVNRLENNSALQVRLNQSVLNDINSKLAKPANPASDSAVTMLADGTVGTKPLNEISGKLYLHSMNFTNSSGIVNVIYYNTDSTPISITNNNIPSGRRFVGMMDGAIRGVVAVYIINNNSTYSASINGCVSSATAETGMAFYNELIDITDSNLTDTVTEV